MSDKFAQYLTEGKEKLKPRLHKLDDKIETFIELIEKKIDKIDDNPIFQRKMNQLLVDMSKEHSEFIVAIRAVVAALDRGGQVVPKVKAVGLARGVGNEDPDAPVEDDAQNAPVEDEQQ